MSGHRGARKGADSVGNPDSFRTQKHHIEAELARLLEQSGSRDAFVHHLVSVLNESVRTHRANPVANALVRELERAAALKNVSAIFHDARSMLQALTSLGHMARVDVLAIVEGLKRIPGHSLHAQLESLLESIEDLDSATKTLTDIIEDGSLLYRESSQSDRNGRLVEAVDAAIRLCQRLDRRTAQKDEIPDLVVAAPTMDLVRVLVSLLSNGAEALAGHPDGQLVVSGWATPTHAFVRVSDNGPGLAPDEREELFDLFFSTKPDGAGIGLHVARILVENWGGRIEIESEVGAGARFTISIPRAK